MRAAMFCRILGGHIFRMKIGFLEVRERLPRSRAAVIAHLALSALLLLCTFGIWFLIITGYEARKLTCNDRGCAINDVSGWFGSARPVWSGKRPLTLQKHPQGTEIGISIVDNNGDTFRLTTLTEGTRRSEELERALGTLEPGLGYTLSQTQVGLEWIVAALALLVGALANMVSSVQMARRWAPPAPLQGR
jgi:hypothetical protein